MENKKNTISVSKGKNIIFFTTFEDEKLWIKTLEDRKVLTDFAVGYINEYLKQKHNLMLSDALYVEYVSESEEEFAVDIY